MCLILPSGTHFLRHPIFPLVFYCMPIITERFIEKRKFKSNREDPSTLLLSHSAPYRSQETVNSHVPSKAYFPKYPLQLFSDSAENFVANRLAIQLRYYKGSAFYREHPWQLCAANLFSPITTINKTNKKKEDKLGQKR